MKTYYIDSRGVVQPMKSLQAAIADNREYK
jgi:hypothetical protein